jgi:hypothetical protein
MTDERNRRRSALWPLPFVGCSVVLVAPTQTLSTDGADVGTLGGKEHDER